MRPFANHARSITVRAPLPDATPRIVTATDHRGVPVSRDWQQSHFAWIG